MVSRSHKEMHLRQDVGVIVLAIRKAAGEMMFNPPAATPVDAGDVLIVMGRTDSLRTLENLVAAARSAQR